jgi:toxin ParE1/3/4
MAKVLLRQKAIDDLNNIWNYTFDQWSAKQADKYYATIKLACNGIGENPNVGKEYDGINKNLLGLKSGKHIIFYKSISDEKENGLEKQNIRIIKTTSTLRRI